MLSISDLPALNAALNATSFVFLTVGYIYIRRGNQQAHKRCMIGALIASSIFLTSYLIYHYHVGATKFTGEGWIRPVYFTILISHVTLAIAIVPLVIITVVRAAKGKFDKHKAIARWTWPLWMYVSVTGIFVYVMLYHLYPS